MGGHRAEVDPQHIDDQVVPGTVQLIDPRQFHGDKVLSEDTETHQTGDIILVPTPSQDPNDPLNWRRRRKLLALSCAVLYTFANGCANSVLYSVLVPLSEATGRSVAELNSGTSYLFLLAGWGLLIWQPIATQYGKRLVYITSMLGCMALTIAAPYMAHDSGMWYARGILAGFFAAPIEALPELTVADLFFTHERGTYLGVYAFFFAGGNFFAPIISGWINLGIGYRWVFFIPGIFCGFVALFLILFQEETNYTRGDHVPLTPITPKKSFLRNLLPVRVTPGRNQLLYRFWLPLRLLAWPLVLYTGISYGGYLIWFNVLNATTSLILSGPPYNFSSGLVGTAYVACILGVIGGAIFNGHINDRIALFLTRRNKTGIYEPEYRLWGFTLTTAVTSAALILWGVGASAGVHWIGLLAASMGLAFSNAAGVLSVTYLVDCYVEISSDALTSLVLVRNTMGFAVGYGITPWVEKLGYRDCFISAAFVALAINSLFILMIWKGKWIREKYKIKYWELVAKHAQMGLVH